MKISSLLLLALFLQGITFTGIVSFCDILSQSQAKMIIAKMIDLEENSNSQDEKDGSGDAENSQVIQDLYPDLFTSLFVLHPRNIGSGNFTASFQLNVFIDIPTAPPKV